MKKVLVFSIVGILLFFGIIAQSQARPLYISIRIGFFAKWSIAIGDCKPGWGICISIPNGPVQNYLGYDSETGKLYLKILKSDPIAKNITQGILEVKEDSPINPKVIQNMTNFKNKYKTLEIKKGIYKVFEEDDYFITEINYSEL